jgi:hypothetical protein
MTPSPLVLRPAGAPFAEADDVRLVLFTSPIEAMAAAPIALCLLVTHRPGRSRTRAALAVQRSAGLGLSDLAASPQDQGRVVEDRQVLPRVVGEHDQVGGCPDLDAR